eukprot:gene12806-biopygen10708
MRGHEREEKLMGYNEPGRGPVMDPPRKATEEAYSPNCMATDDVVLPRNTSKPAQLQGASRKESGWNTWKFEGRGFWGQTPVHQLSGKRKRSGESGSSCRTPDRNSNALERKPFTIARVSVEERRRRAQAIDSPAELMESIKACTDLHGLDQVITDDGWRFDHAKVSAAMNRVVKLHRRNQVVMAQEMMQDLSALALREVNAMDPRSLSSLLWALGKVGGPVNPVLVQRILVRTKENSASFNAHDISNVLWAMAKLCVPPSDLIHELMDAATRRFPGFKPQALANTLWALATMEIPVDGPFLEGWIKYAVQKMPEFNARDLPETFWAASKLSIKDEAFNTAWLREARKKLPGFNAQGLSMSLWAAAKQGINDEAFNATWLREAKQKLPDFSALGLSNTLWAVAMLGIDDRAFIATWLREAKKKLLDLDAQGLSNTLLAAAKLGIEDEVFTAALVREVKKKMCYFNARDLSESLCAAAKLYIEDESFTAVLVREAKLKLSDFCLADLQHIATALASSDCRIVDAGFRSLITERIRSLIAR